jgi:fatty acid hydroxylase domain-containing protein 2
MLIDWKGWLKQYKIQLQNNESTNDGRLLKTIKVVVLNMFLVNTLFTIFLRMNVKSKDLPCIQTLPTAHRLVIDLIACTVVREIFFYYVHRLLHQKLFYKFIHKRHHEWTAPIAIAAVYCHPLEHFFSNVLPLNGTVLILQPHLLTAALFYTSAIVHTIVVHSGYHLPFLPSPENHDFHHAR